MNNKGLSVVELIVSFVLCILVFVFIIQVVIVVEELYVNLGIKTELLNKQSLISENMNNKFINNDIILIKNCGDNCFTFFYKNNTSEKMFINKETNTFVFGNDAFSFNGLGFVDELNISISDDRIYKQAIFKVDLNIKNSIFDNNKYVIKALHQYDINETVYSRSEANIAEILLLGPAVSYKFSEDVFMETGWMVYYPDGTITINEDDVTPGAIEFDQEGNGAITYTGNNAAAGATATRIIKNYETAKARISRLYEEDANSNIHLYGNIGKYVYKGSNPNNYIVIGSKMFRIISLDTQLVNMRDENGEFIYDNNGEKIQESQYLLKVIGEELITDASGNHEFKFGTATPGEQLYNISCWMMTTGHEVQYESNLNNCKYNGGPNLLTQNINTIVNDVWLQSLLNTGTGRMQIKNGAFNVGIISFETYKFGPAFIEPGVYGITDMYINSNNEDLRWRGNCLEDEVCPPNAGIVSLTDVLLASSKNTCIEDVIVTTDGGNLSISCFDENWLWHADNIYLSYRMMTRSSLNNTWILTNSRYFTYDTVSAAYATKGVVYLDANLYILGTGTIDNPYSLYTITK